MTVYIDPPNWPGHGRMWSHLVSDVSYAELQSFADRLGVPRRAFERDHYDIPSPRYDEVVAAGAVEVSSREVVRLLTESGLRRRKGGGRDREQGDGGPDGGRGDGGGVSR